MPKKETMDELYAALKKGFLKSPQHNALIKAIKDVNNYTASLRKKDRYKRLPYVTEEQKRTLMDLHKRVAGAADAVLQGSDSERIKDVVRKFSGLAARNYTTIAAYDPAKPKSLATIEEQTRALRLDQRGGGKLRTVVLGGEKRQLVTFLNERGKPVTGFFTPKTITNPVEAVKNAFRTAAQSAASDESKQLLERFLEREKEKLRRESPGKEPDDADAIRSVLDRCTTTRDDKLVVDYEALETEIRESDGAYMPMSKAQFQNDVGPGTIQALADALDNSRTAVEDQLGAAKLQNGSRLDNRACAVSAVADLLGCPEAVTRARPMVLIDADGNEIEGTFTLAGKGAYTDNLIDESAASYVSEDSLRKTNGNVFRNIADIQVLDYICGNPNRSGENLNYSIDPTTYRFTGVQAINNETSFGTLVPKEGEGAGKLPAPENMRVVSRSTYERVMALDRASLKYALRGFGLTEQELDAAGERLTTLQRALKKGVEHYDKLKKDETLDNNKLIQGNNQPGDDSFFSFSGDEQYVNESGEESTALTLDPNVIRVVDDDEFYRLNREDLSATTDPITGKQAEGDAGGPGNTFYEVYDQILRLPGQRDAQQEEREQNRRRAVKLEAGPEQTFGAGNRCVPSMLHENALQANELSLQLTRNDRGGWFRKFSNYRAMQNAVDEYAQYSRKLYERIQRAGDPELRRLPGYRRDLEAIVRPHELKKLQQLAAKVAKSAEKYLQGKGVLAKTQGGVPTHEIEDFDLHTQARIHVAQQALMMGKRDARIRPEEVDAAKVNERRAKEALSRRIGTEKEQLQNGRFAQGGPVNDEIITI